LVKPLGSSGLIAPPIVLPIFGRRKQPVLNLDRSLSLYRAGKGGETYCGVSSAAASLARAR
jgi:hypothetical protein